MYDSNNEVQSLSSSMNDSYSENESQDDELDEYLSTDASPLKKKTEFEIYRKNKQCRFLTSLESTENHFIVPLLMNCKQENPEIISTSVPFEVQQNALLVIDMDTLAEREDILSDDNGAWKQNGCKTKFFLTSKDSDDRVIGLTRVSKDEQGDIAVRRRYYTCMSCPSYHRVVVTIEFGRDISQWHPIVFMQYRYDGEEVKFDVKSHGNRNEDDGKPYVRTKCSTKVKSSRHLQGNGPKRALFKTVKDVGGVSKCESEGSLPRNTRQMRYLKKKADKEQSAQSRDPLASVIELQKSVLPGFVREITCNNLPTVILFTDQQIDNIVKFCCSKKKGFVSELGVDLTFQLGPFYLLVTTFKNTLLKVKGSEHCPTFLGPMMVCMTKDQQTYLSFIHRLVREVPGLSKFLHAYGTDSEDALTNALAAGFPSSAHLLCYIHCKKNVQEKCKQIGLSQALTSQICSDLFGRHGLLWCQSSELFEKQTTQLVEKWDALESNERKCDPQFASYFLRYKKQDMKNKMCRFVVSNLGLGDAPYTQNVVESANDLIKDWVNFTAQDMDKLIMALYELIGSFDEEEELAWFGLSEKWEVRAEYQLLCPKGFSNMTPDQRQGEITKMRKTRPDATAYNNCKSFKFSSPRASEQGRPDQSTSIIQPHILQPLTRHFSEEEVSGIKTKAEALLQSNRFREGFKDGVYFVDSGESIPYKVTCFKSGKTTCGCSYYSRNSICCHSVAIAKHKERMPGLLKNFPGRNLNNVAATSAPKSVGSKKPPRPSRKRRLETPAVETLPPSKSPTATNEPSTNFSVRNINPTNLVISRNKKPSDPATSSPLVVKRIAGGIRKCSGCGKPILKTLPGFESEEDSLYCLGRHEAYYFWNQNEGCYKITSGVRHYHMNDVCTNLTPILHQRSQAAKFN